MFKECTSDRACQLAQRTANSTATCNSGFQTVVRKFFTCSITEQPYLGLVGNIIQLQCAGVPNNSTSSVRGTCDIQIFDGIQETIYCHLAQCYSFFGPGTSLSVLFN